MKFPKLKSLETKFFLLLATLAIIPPMALLWFVVEPLDSWNDEVIVRENQLIADTVQSELERSIKKSVSNLNLFLKNYKRTDNIGNTLLNDFERYSAFMTDFELVGLTDKEGKVLSVFPENQKKVLDQILSNMNQYKEVPFENSAGRSEPRFSVRSHLFNLYIFIPLEKMKKRERMLVAQIDTGQTKQLMKFFERNQQGRLLLFDGEDSFLSSDGVIKIDSSLEFGRRELEELKTELTTELHLQGVPTVSTYLPFKHSGWGIIFQKPSVLISTDIKSVTRTFPYLFVLLILCLPIISFIMVRKMIQPLKNLVLGANEIKQGNFKVVIPENSEDEIGMLAHSFNSMRQNIAEKIGSLQQSYSKQSQLIEEERERISRELHDVVLQQFGLITRNLSNGNIDCPVEIENQCQLMKNRDLLLEMTRSGEVEIRKIITDLYPSSLKEMGLVVALQSFIRALNLRFDTQLVFHGSELKRFTPEIELVFFRIAQESATNIVKHSGQKTGEIFLGFNNEKIWLQIEDEGEGFDVDQVKKNGHFGLSYMQERAEQIGATLTIHSEKGQGTTLFLELIFTNST